MDDFVHSSLVSDDFVFYFIDFGCLCAFLIDFGWAFALSAAHRHALIVLLPNPPSKGTDRGIARADIDNIDIDTCSDAAKQRKHGKYDSRDGSALDAAHLGSELIMTTCAACHRCAGNDGRNGDEQVTDIEHAEDDCKDSSAPEAGGRAFGCPIYLAPRALADDVYDNEQKYDGSGCARKHSHVEARGVGWWWWWWIWRRRGGRG